MKTLIWVLAVVFVVISAVLATYNLTKPKIGRLDILALGFLAAAVGLVSVYLVIS